MKKFSYLSLLAFFALFLLAGLSAGRMFGIQSKEAETPTPIKPPSPELQVKSRTNQLQAEKASILEFPQVATPAPVDPDAPLSEDLEQDDGPATEEAQAEAESMQQASQPDTTQAETRPRSVTQKNILVIGVDNLQAKSPRLEGVWLVLYLTQKPEFTLMPIFPGKPAEDGKMRSQDYKLARLFRSDQATFFTELEKRGIRWSGYYKLDRTALEEIAGKVDDLAVEPGESTRLEVDDVPFYEEDLQVAKLGQGRFAQALCDRGAHLSVDQISELDDLFLLFSDHILSDIPKEQAAAELVGMLVEGSPITCEFPSMAEESISP